ncbi:hypothetical protein HPB52_011628 [Rhipicephalus sanguineus]|uniref:c-SKI SMAD4-binding domain-containing protein n=1 Tax=Rhipicephalus sanguineus TaxID=34632 RepID=A0A9D4SYB1_RHISA|nr:hypothetical protein HPB52_011628 [Rhipicephalus sanguineus]
MNPNRLQRVMVAPQSAAPGPAARKSDKRAVWWSVCEGGSREEDAGQMAGVIRGRQCAAFPRCSQEQPHPAPRSSGGGSRHSSSQQQQQQQQAAAAAAANEVRTVLLYGVPIVALVIEGQERLSLAQISNTLLKDYSYNEIHNRRVALGITCVQCTPVQLELLRRAGAMPVSSRRCGMITKREAERLCKSFLTDTPPPKLPENFAFDVSHQCAWGCRGSFVPARYNSSRAKCIKCAYCSLFFSPNKFIFHSHRLPDSKYVQPDAANFNSWRRHIKLSGTPPEDVSYAWEDVKAMFNGGSRRRVAVSSSSSSSSSSSASKRARSSAGDRDALQVGLPVTPDCRRCLPALTGFAGTISRNYLIVNAA